MVLIMGEVTASHIVRVSGFNQKQLIGEGRRGRGWFRCMILGHRLRVRNVSQLRQLLVLHGATRVVVEYEVPARGAGL